MTDKSANTAKFVQATKPLFPALFLAAGFSISTIFPAFAGTSQKTQLISQSGKKVEITLVTYAVTKAAYAKIIPQFVAKWKKEKGQGDALLNYENEVILAAQQGKTDTSYIIPPVNISIDAPVAVVDKNVDKHGNREVSEAFVKFLFTPEAQREFSKVGFRPIDPTVAKEVKNKFPYIARLYTVADLGGWSAVQKKFFADGSIFDKIQRGRR